MNITQLFLEKGYLLDSDIQEILANVNYLIQKDLVDIFSNIIMHQHKEQKIISKKDLLENITKINLVLQNIKNNHPEKKEVFDSTMQYFESLLQKPSEKKPFKFELEKEINLNNSESQTKNVLAAEPITIIKSYSIPSRKICVEDFTKHFRIRYATTKNILEERMESNLISIGKIGIEKKQVNIIGMVSNKQVTKNKNIMLEVEDTTGKTKVLIGKTKGSLYSKASEIILDEVIGIKASGNEEILFANDIIFPDLLARKISTNYDEYAVFIADLHIGSSHFLEEKFKFFIQWINGELGTDEQKQIAQKTKYLFVVGDVIDGVGVHPLQEALLEITDVRKQYEKAAELLNMIRKDISIILCPGNHDALRIAEPQPQFDEDYAKPLHELTNAFFVSNPSTVCVRGINFLLYHGRSFDYYVANVDSLRMGNAYHNPRLISAFLLKKRHLAPTHTSTQYLPCENEDPLAIKIIPDVFVSAHIHKSDVSSYNNLLTISCSCFQSKTPLEEKLGHEPDPGMIPILHMKTGSVKILDFS